MQDNSLKLSSTVPAYETGPDDRMHCHWLMCRLQEGATAHADSLGFGIEDMAKLGCFWVLTSMRIELEELPEREKLFSLRTWSRGAKRLRAFRDFSGCDESGREIVRATTEWMVLDARTRKPITIDERLNMHARDESVFEDEVKRLRPGKPVRELRTLNVGYSSLDANGHVNNTEYLRWSLDALRPLGLDQNKLKSVRIGFLSEVFEGNTVKLMDCGCENGGYEILGYNETEDRAAFALHVE